MSKKIIKLTLTQDLTNIYVNVDAINHFVGVKNEADEMTVITTPQGALHVTIAAAELQSIINGDKPLPAARKPRKVAAAEVKAKPTRRKANGKR